LLALASQEIAKLRSEANAAIARDRAAAEQAIIARASELAVEIARRLLGRLPPEMALPAFLDSLSQKVRALPPEARESFTSAAADHAVAAVTATSLSEGEAKRVRDTLKTAFGAELPLAFRADATLISGIELHSPHTVVRNSWQADLERIREELSRDGHSSES
jgi:F-type H+-transporting ATPase subunit b